ncbi:MAG: hypothetical protein WBQ75_12030, partial [Acetobacteraceae bacterium]
LAARASGLFAEPAQAQPAPVAASTPELIRPSLFGTVTGVLLRRRAGVVAIQESHIARVEPVVTERAEAPAATVRAVAGEEMGIEIPTFLRRQSS